MKIPHACKIEEVASSDETRLTINDLYLAGQEGDIPPRLIASDGRMLVELPVATEADETPGLISKHAVRIERHNGERSEILPHDFELKSNQTAHLLSRGAVMSRPTGKYPNFRENIDRPYVAVAVSKITLDAEQLVKIQRALGCAAVVLEFTGETDQIHIRPDSRFAALPSARALLMPFRPS